MSTNNYITQEIAQIFRAVAWQHAKAELLSLGYSDFPPRGYDRRDAWEEKCERRRVLIDEFIKTMEAGELY